MKLEIEIDGDGTYHTLCKRNYKKDGTLLSVDRIFHREDGPAIEWSNGDKEWWLNGNRHREDGPAIEFTTGIKRWYYFGKQYYCEDNETYLKIIKLKMFW